jgi:hypothetical protein
MEIKKDNIEKPIIPTEVESNDKIPTPMNGVYNIMIRIVVLLVVYILLYTVLYYNDLRNFNTFIIVLISFFISKPFTKIIISNVFPKLIK